MDRFHIIAWNEDGVGVDYTSDDYPDGLAKEYQFVSVARLTPVSKEALEDALYDRQ